jgi:hypothetical protein
VFWPWTFPNFFATLLSSIYEKFVNEMMQASRHTHNLDQVADLVSTGKLESGL